MSIASYFFISNLDEAKNSEELPNVPEGNLKTFYGVMNTSVECLYPILKVGEDIDLNDIAQSEDYTSCTFSFPQEYIDTLCSTDTSKESVLIENWMKIEDCPYDNKQDLSDLLNALIDLAKIANSTDQALYFRMEM